MAAVDVISKMESLLASFTKLGVKDEVKEESIKENEHSIDSMKIANRGTGAGGKNTNATGKAFEGKTEHETRLMENGYVKKTLKKHYYLEKTFDTHTIWYLTQGNLKAYMMNTHNKKLFRHPDEAYLIHKNGKYVLKVLEKKAQNGAGSVDTKLCAGPYFKEEYAECLGENFTVEYAFCLSSYLQKEYLSTQEKYKVMRTINKRHNIEVFFGDDEDYASKLDTWINS